MFHTRGLTCQQSPKWYFVFIHNLWTFNKFSSVWSVERWPECSQFSVSFPTTHSWKPLRILSFYDIVTKTCVEHLFPMQFTRVWNKTYDQCVVPPYQPIENLRSYFIYTMINTHRKAVQRCLTTKLTTVTQKIAILWHLVAESCNTCHSWS
jgi:hypothetical protein